MRLQDTVTGEIWEFDETQDPRTIAGVPKTLSADIKEKPSETHVWKNGTWVSDPTLVENQYKVIEAQVLGRRNAMLAASDWIVTVCAEKGKEVPQDWQQYRQILRDITLQPNYPFNVVWPSEPSTKV